MFLAHGVARQGSNYRPGARHALMLFATGESLHLARSEAIAGAANRGWAHVEVKREKPLGRDATGIEDEILRPAAETALADGAAIVVYAQEIPLNS
jgi:hypothetical protein